MTEPDTTPRSAIEPMKVDMPRLTLAGIALWVVALVVILAVPSLREGDRHWWPWVPVCGIVLGLMGYIYVRRGRGNASAA